MNKDWWYVETRGSDVGTVMRDQDWGWLAPSWRDSREERTELELLP